MTYDRFPQNNLIHVALLSPIAYVLSIMWVIPDGYKYTPVVIILSAAAFISLKGWRLVRHSGSNPRKPYYLSIIITTLYFIATYKINDGNVSELRTLTALCIYFSIIYNYEIPINFWKYTLLVSGSLFITVCFYQFLLEDVRRTSLHYNPIPFATGVASILVAVTAIALTNQSRSKPVYAAVALLLLVALATTGTRGVLLPIFILTVSTFYFIIKRSRKKSFGASVVAIFITVLSVSIPAYIFNDRITHTISDLKKVETGDLSGSIGLRFQFWKAAVEIAKENPTFGSGENHRRQFQLLSNKKIISQEAINYEPRHYHNQYLDNLVKRGLIGLIILLATFFIAIIQSYRSSGYNSWRFWTIASIVFLYGFSSLTDVPLNHPPVIFTYYIITFVLLPVKRKKRLSNPTIPS